MNERNQSSKERGQGSHETYVKMIERMDSGVGKILSMLEANGLTETPSLFSLGTTRQRMDATRRSPAAKAIIRGRHPRAVHRSLSGRVYARERDGCAGTMDDGHDGIACAAGAVQRRQKVVHSTHRHPHGMESERVRTKRVSTGGRGAGKNVARRARRLAEVSFAEGR